MPQKETSPDAWFVSEILPNERDLDAFLQTRCDDSDEVEDVRQEVYARLYQYAQSCSAYPENARAFLFSAARNMLIDRIRRKRIVSFEQVMDFENLNVFENEPGPDRFAQGRIEFAALKIALDNLPGRTRDIIWLRRVEGLSQRQTAERLNISQPTVERHLAKGVRLLADTLGRSSARKKENLKGGTPIKRDQNDKSAKRKG